MGIKGKNIKITAITAGILLAFAFSGCGSKHTAEKGPAWENTRRDAEDGNRDADAQKEAEAAEKGAETIQWFNNTYAVLTAVNGWDYTVFGGLPENEKSRETARTLLDQWWEVTDRETADKNMDWLLEEGHRKAFGKDMRYLADTGLLDIPGEEREDFLFENYDIDREEAQKYAAWLALYEQHGEDAAAAWDFCRAMSLYGYYYLAGYYTREEALDGSLKTAGIIQKTFGSWDDLMESYFTGYEYWQGSDSLERREIYENIKKAPDSPYALDFHLPLEKNW